MQTELSAQAGPGTGLPVYGLKDLPEVLDGVRVFSPEGKPLAHIRLPERCAKLCFGGRKNKRLYMAGSHSSSTSRPTAPPEPGGTQHAGQGGPAYDGSFP